MSWFRDILWMAHKDLRILFRRADLVISTLVFATIVVVIAALALFTDPVRAPRVVPGVLWIAILFAGMLALGGSWSREGEGQPLSALWLSPITRSAIYLGKVLSVCVWMALIECVLVFLITVFFQTPLVQHALPLIAILALGTFGFIGAGTLFSALGARRTQNDLLMSVVVFPLITPILLSAVAATRQLLLGAPNDEIMGWVQILIAADVVTIVAGSVLFEYLLDD